MDSPSPRPFQCAVIQEIASPPSLLTFSSSPTPHLPLPLILSSSISHFLSFRTFPYFSFFSSLTFRIPLFPYPTPSSPPVLFPPLFLFPLPSPRILPFSFLYSPLPPPPLFPSLYRDSIPCGVDIPSGLLAPFCLHIPFSLRLSCFIV